MPETHMRQMKHHGNSSRSGTASKTPQGVEKPSKSSTEDSWSEGSAPNAPEDKTDRNRIFHPSVWQHVLQTVGSDLSDYEVDILSYISDLKVTTPEDRNLEKNPHQEHSGETITIWFADNPFFHDKYLSRSHRETPADSGPTEIHWKKKPEDKDVLSLTLLRLFLVETKDMQSDPYLQSWDRFTGQAYPNPYEWLSRAKDPTHLMELMYPIKDILAKQKEAYPERTLCEASARMIQSQKIDIHLEEITKQRKIHPFIWYQAFEAYGTSEFELDILYYLADITIDEYANEIDPEDPNEIEDYFPGFTVSMRFKENPHFKNETLIRHWIGNKEHIGPTTIHWKRIPKISELLSLDFFRIFIQEDKDLEWYGPWEEFVDIIWKDPYGYINRSRNLLSKLQD